MADGAGLPYRDCVGIAVFNRAGKAFIGRRRPEEDPEDSAELGAPWQMPQGGIDRGEDPFATARRELREETGITSVRELDRIPDWLAYDLPPHEIGRAFKGKYRGQRQLWFAFLFTGEESEIDVLAPGGGDLAEFDAWRWEDLERLPTLVVPFKRVVYAEVVNRFAGLPERIRAGL